MLNEKSHRDRLLERKMLNEMELDSLAENITRLENIISSLEDLKLSKESLNKKLILQIERYDYDNQGRNNDNF